MNGLRWRMAVIFVVLAACVAYSLPSLLGGSTLGGLLPDKRVSLGLDLQGGIHLTL